MKIRVVELRRMIREIIKESYGGSLGIDPTSLETSSQGFYPYDLERGVDLYATWYRSPGSSEGDPGRPADAADYIGMSAEEPEEGSAEETGT